MTVTVSAPGKLILCGEHTVVFGKPALLTAIDKRLYVTIKKAKKTGIDSLEEKSIIIKALNIFKRLYPHDKLPPMHISIRSEIPIGVGLGSSAALSVALMGALLKFIKNIWNPHRINELAYEAEKLQHGNPSGADNTISTFGGLLWYRKEFEFLKSLWALPLHSYTLPLITLVNSGKPKETTKEMVKIVQDRLHKKKTKGQDILNGQEHITKELVMAMRKNSQEAIKKCIFQAEKNLEQLGVVSDKTKRFIRQIENEGGSAKICGAGGKKDASGVILCYHKSAHTINKLASRWKYDVIQTKLGEEGVRLEKDIS